MTIRERVGDRTEPCKAPLSIDLGEVKVERPERKLKKKYREKQNPEGNLESKD